MRHPPPCEPSSLIMDIIIGISLEGLVAIYFCGVYSYSLKSGLLVAPDSTSLTVLLPPTPTLMSLLFSWPLTKLSLRLTTYHHM